LAYYHLVFYLHLPFFLPVFGPFPFGPVPSLLGINFTPVLWILIQNIMNIYS
jgi:hypothetical protein